MLKKATGADGLNVKFLKLAAPYIAAPLTYIFNLSINKCQFPNMWKLTKVIPIFKKGDCIKPENFRPISILNALSKIIERHVHNSFYSYLNSHNLIVSNQSGFRKNQCCQTSLLYMTEN